MGEKTSYYNKFFKGVHTLRGLRLELVELGSLFLEEDISLTCGCNWFYNHGKYCNWMKI
jgi:hypothetical protein